MEDPSTLFSTSGRRERQARTARIRQATGPDSASEMLGRTAEMAILATLLSEE